MSLLKVNAEWQAELHREHEAMQHDIERMQAREVELLAENKRLRSALVMIREITGQDSVFHEADSALEGHGGEGCR